MLAAKVPQIHPSRVRDGATMPSSVSRTFVNSTSRSTTRRRNSVSRSNQRRASTNQKLAPASRRRSSGALSKHTTQYPEARQTTEESRSCLDPKLRCSGDVTGIIYDGRTYVDLFQSRDDEPPRTLAKINRESLLCKNGARIRNKKGQIIAIMHRSPKTNAVYLFRDTPAFVGQAPLSPSLGKLMFGDNFTKQIYRYAKITRRNGTYFYNVAISGRKGGGGGVVYRREYSAVVDDCGEIIYFDTDSGSSNLAAKSTADKFGINVVFQIEKRVDIAAVIALEQTIYASDCESE